MVQAYSQNQTAAHPHPPPKSVHTSIPCSTACASKQKNAAHPTSFISAGFPPAVKVSGTPTPVPHKALTGEDTAAIVESTAEPEQLETFNREWELNYLSNPRSNTRSRVNAYHEQSRVGMVFAPHQPRNPRNGEPQPARQTQRPLPFPRAAC